MAKQNITPREKDYSQWYIDIVENAKLADYSPVKGSMVIRPNGYALWEKIRDELDKKFKETGHRNAYFPMLIPESFLKKEAEHVEGFSPELAVVTHAGGKELEEPYVVRPTSETIIWAMFRKWINSWRDLPLLINQWANVVRWELRPRLFLRTTEFLWQEGHTAHETFEEAEEETVKILHLYKDFVNEYMALPLYYGLKSESEKFAGAVKTYCIEAMMQDNRALQAGTTHNLGQNFAKAFDVKFQNRDGQEEYVFASSWGVSTRLIGALVMSHSDDDGLVIPPKIADDKVVIIPIYKEKDKSLVLNKVDEIAKELNSHNIKTTVDDRENQRPGFKHNEWEVMGMPVRIEIGPRDIAEDKVMLARRDLKKKDAYPIKGLTNTINTMLDEMQSNLYSNALKRMKDNTIKIDDYEEMKKLNAEGNGFFLAHWDGSAETETKLKEETKMTIRCIPTDEEKEEGKCIISGRPSKQRVIMAKAY